MKFPAFTARDWSLRTRLLLIAALASLATLLAGSAAMVWAAEKEDQRLLDSRLEDLARTLLSFSEHEITEILGEGRTEMMHTETAGRWARATATRSGRATAPWCCTAT